MPYASSNPQSEIRNLKSPIFTMEHLLSLILKYLQRLFAPEAEDHFFERSVLLFQGFGHSGQHDSGTPVFGKAEYPGASNCSEWHPPASDPHRPRPCVAQLRELRISL
jgi:hypothetical protein